jgi:predicted nucleic acid-binding protein
METLTRVLLDSSILIPALRVGGGGLEKQRVVQWLTNGRAALTESILLELWRGSKPGIEQEGVSRFARDLPLLKTTSGVWEKCFELARRCRAKGFQIPMGDLLVGACAWEYGVVIEQNDSHFEQIQSVLSETHILVP